MKYIWVTMHCCPKPGYWDWTYQLLRKHSNKSICIQTLFICRGTSWICQIMLLSKSPPLIDPLKINYGCLLRCLLGEEPTPTCQKWALCTRTTNGSKKLVNFNCAQTQFYLFELFLHSS